MEVEGGREPVTSEEGRIQKDQRDLRELLINTKLSVSDVVGDDRAFIPQNRVDDVRAEVQLVADENARILQRSENLPTATRATFKEYVRRVYEEIETEVKVLQSTVKRLLANRDVPECFADVDSTFQDTEVIDAVTRVASTGPLSR